MEIPLFKIHWNEDDIDAVNRIIRSGLYWCMGRDIEEFEQEIAAYLGSDYCVLLNSGGSALQALMVAYNFQKGDEIIVPSFTFIASAYAPLYVGARPVFADIEEDTYGLDPEDVKRKITNKTKAILPVHYGGMPCRVDILNELAEDYGLLLIEDAAEALGAKLGAKAIGTFGHSSIFSFCQNKVITTSEGGCLVTNDSTINEKARLFRSYGRVITGDYFAGGTDLDYVESGFNLRMSTLLASLGRSQLKRINDLIVMRQKNAHFLIEKFNDLDEISCPMPPNKDFFSVYQMFTLRVRTGQKKRDALMKHLSDKGISSKVYFDPVHQYSVFRKLGHHTIQLPVTERVASEVLTIPMYPHMTKEELEYLSTSIIEFF
ncbi:MAG: aminotransferase DegT [Candidatus Thorarchaeota archaeon SMTZ-45]|nr:MAG: aminotransferase DegT [Candidatus Thorarchaeota archaeon SMTZ1-45]KXH76729.1 MAG: aminotransferase DegT [Candidatus Thorarchaeota archaeon SMTZ-45]